MQKESLAADNGSVVEVLLADLFPLWLPDLLARWRANISVPKLSLTFADLLRLSRNLTDALAGLADRRQHDLSLLLPDSPSVVAYSDAKCTNNTEL